MAAQGVSVRSLAADYAKLRAAQNMPASSIPTRNISANGSTVTASTVSSIDQEGLVRIEGSVDRLSRKIGVMGHLPPGYFWRNRLRPTWPHARLSKNPSHDARHRCEHQDRRHRKHGGKGQPHPPAGYGLGKPHGAEQPYQKHPHGDGAAGEPRVEFFRMTEHD